ncbi:hypothetical protein TNIN_163031 [Trichonephila inaurata madagascariensis]|uniref:Uncharacterized protein n=1 Tax=Trichonephila inaurata madagascariensis TaxID=2747483 RepID=A0A8X6YKR9_9ARAC|nr:hypothetical protein TNIN_163031 [Trichonephila inaurata madagascariensis]
MPEEVGPSDFDDQTLLAPFGKKDESLTTRMLAEDFNVNQSTALRQQQSRWRISKHAHCKKAMWWDRSARGIDRLQSKWEAVIGVDGDYAPE